MELRRETTIAALSELSAACLMPKCSRRAVAGHRGQCHSHYNGNADLIRKGITTWALLIEVGWALPPRPSLKQLVPKAS